MFFLSKLFNIFFLPPGLFIILIIISILFIIKNKIKTGIITLIITTLIFYLLSILPIKNLLLIPLEFQKRLEENTNTEFDTIVILSGGTSVITPDRNMKNSLSYESFQRTYMGFILWKIKKVPIIVSGGKSFGSIEADAITMENVLIELGIPKDQIIKEIKSRNTIENGLFTKSIIEKYKFKKIALVTSAYHMKRSVFVFKKLNIDIIPFATDYLCTYKRFNISYFIPDFSNLKSSNIAIHEYIGLIYYKFLMKKYI